MEFLKNSGSWYGGAESMGIQASAKIKYQLIHETLMQKDNVLNVSALCRIAGVSRSGYYAWIHAASARQKHEEQDLADFALIKQAYEFRDYKKRSTKHLYASSAYESTSCNEFEKDSKAHGQVRTVLPDPRSKSHEDEPYCAKYREPRF